MAASAQTAREVFARPPPQRAARSNSADLGKDDGRLGGPQSRLPFGWGWRIPLLGELSATACCPCTDSRTWATAGKMRAFASGGVPRPTSPTSRPEALARENA